MKFASLKSNSPDGQLHLVSRDLNKAYCLSHISPNLQHAIEHWHKLLPEFEELSQKLNQGSLAHSIPFDVKNVNSPLPRAYQWADGSAYLHHVRLVRKARGAEMPEQFLTDPLMYQGGSDQFLGPCDPIEVQRIEDGVDFEAEIAVITDKVMMGSSPALCSQKILLFMLVNDVTLRELIPLELAKGFGFFHSKPSSSFSPVAITPDELGDAWDGQRIHLPLFTELNSKPFGHPNAGIGMHFSFPELIAHAAKTRTLSAGTIVGSGTVSNDDPNVGSSCIVEKRMLEIIAQGKAHTPYMNFGDDVKIEMLDKQGNSLFGAIEQKVVHYKSEFNHEHSL